MGKKLSLLFETVTLDAVRKCGEFDIIIIERFLYLENSFLIEVELYGPVYGKNCLVILLSIIQCGRPTHPIMLVVIVESFFNNVLKS